MYGDILRDVAEVRHTDLMREAAHARRVAAARRSGATPKPVWRRRIGALLIDLRRAIIHQPVGTPTPATERTRRYGP